MSSKGKSGQDRAQSVKASRERPEAGEDTHHCLSLRRTLHHQNHGYQCRCSSAGLTSILRMTTTYRLNMDIYVKDVPASRPPRLDAGLESICRSARTERRPPHLSTPRSPPTSLAGACLGQRRSPSRYRPAAAAAAAEARVRLRSSRSFGPFSFSSYSSSSSSFPSFSSSPPLLSRPPRQRFGFEMKSGVGGSRS